MWAEQLHCQPIYWAIFVPFLSSRSYATSHVDPGASPRGPVERLTEAAPSNYRFASTSTETRSSGRDQITEVQSVLMSTVADRGRLPAGVLGSGSSLPRFQNSGLGFSGELPYSRSSRELTLLVFRRCG